MSKDKNKLFYVLCGSCESTSTRMQVKLTEDTEYYIVRLFCKDCNRTEVWKLPAVHTDFLEE